MCWNFLKSENGKALERLANIIVAVGTLIAMGALVIQWRQLRIAKNQFNEQLKTQTEQLKLTRDQYYELNRPFLTVDRINYGGDQTYFLVKNHGETAAVDSKFTAFYRDSNDKVINLYGPRPIGVFYPNEELVFPVSICRQAGQMKNRTFNIRIEYKFQKKCVRYKVPMQIEDRGCILNAQSREEEPC